MLGLWFYLALTGLVSYAVISAVRAAFVADSAERRKFTEFADKVEDWMKGMRDEKP